jgi:cytochrome c-type biogenesis protein CcmE
MSQQAGPLFALGALAVAGIAVAVVAFGDLGENLVYYWSPTEVVEKGEAARGATIRLGGMVEPSSLAWTPGEPGSFRVTDGKNTIPVQVEGVPPQMFREGIGVVVEGTLASDGTFRSERLMVKHSNEYRAPDDPEGQVDMQALSGTLQGSP